MSNTFLASRYNCEHVGRCCSIFSPNIPQHTEKSQVHKWGWRTSIRRTSTCCKVLALLNIAWQRQVFIGINQDLVHLLFRKSMKCVQFIHLTDYGVWASFTFSECVSKFQTYLKFRQSPLTTLRSGFGNNGFEPEVRASLTFNSTRWEVSDILEM